MLVHDRGYLIATDPRRHLRLLPPGRHRHPAQPALPEPAGAIGDCHDADITPDTIIPPWYGERLDLDHAIYTCLANARTAGGTAGQREQATGLPPAIASRSSNRRAGPTGYASTTTSTPCDQHTAA